MTNHKTKKESVTMLIESYFKKKKIVFYHNFFNAEHEYSAVDDIKSECISQLRNFSQKRVINKEKDGTLQAEIYYSGKHGGTRNDDFVMALLIVIYNHKIFFTNPYYKKYWV